MKILYFSKRGKKELSQSNHCFSIFCHWEAKKKAEQKHMDLNGCNQMTTDVNGTVN